MGKGEGKGEGRGEGKGAKSETSLWDLCAEVDEVSFTALLRARYAGVAGGGGWLCRRVERETDRTCAHLDVPCAELCTYRCPACRVRYPRNFSLACMN
jgi:hypothetical protein